MQAQRADDAPARGRGAALNAMGDPTPRYRAAMCERYGPYREVVAVRDVPRVPLGPGQLRLRIAYAPVSRGQLVLIEGRYQRRPALPFCAGGEVSGTVIEVGPGVEGRSVGDRVCAALDLGGYAQEAVATASTVYPIPDALGMAEAACLPSTYGTCHAALHWRGRLKAGETVLVLGAAGGVGLATVEVARAAGARVFATGSTEAKRALALAHGADRVFPADPDSLRDAVLAATDGRGVDLVFDPVGGRLGEEALRCLGPEGRHLIIGFASDAVPSAAFNVLLVKNVELVGFWFGQYVGWGRVDERERYAPRMRAMVDALAADCLAGRIRPRTDTRIPLERIVEAFDVVAMRRGTGRVLVDMGG